MQIIPPSEEMQPKTKQLKPRPDPNRLQIPTRIRSTKRKKKEEDSEKKKRHEGQISHPKEMPTGKTSNQRKKKQTLRRKAEQCEAKKQNKTQRKKKKADRKHCTQKQNAEEARHRGLTLITGTVEEQNDIRTTTRGKETERDTAEQEKADQKHVTQKQEASEPRHRSLTLSTRTVEEQEQNNNGTITDTTVTIQTTEGSYDARLVEGDSNNRPVRKKMKLARYRISMPPRMMRNISKYYTAEKLQNQQVLKFDIRNPDPSRQLRNRRKGNSEHTDRECLIETSGQIQEKKTRPRAKHKNQDTAQRNTGRGLHQKRTS